MDNQAPYIASLDHFPIEKSMFSEMETSDLLIRYRTNKELISNLSSRLNLNKSIQKEYWQNAWIQTYTIENRIILSILNDRTENVDLGSFSDEYYGKGGIDGK